MTATTERNFWRDRPTLVTGATGLIGSWLVRRLLEFDADVVCLIRDWLPQSELLSSRLIERVKAVRGDVRDQALLERVLGEFEVDTVIHLAAQTTVGIACRNPISTFETNIRGTWTLFESCRRSPGVRQIVLASSDKAYGAQERLPYAEEMRLQGRHPYDVSKSCADLIAQAYAAAFSLPVVVSRCGNIYGGGDLNWNRLVPATIRRVLRGRPPIIRSDGQHVRDYLHVEDGAAAYSLLAQRLDDNPGLRGEAFNFSNETQVTDLQLVERILTLMGSDLKPVVRNDATNEIRCQYLSTAKARRMLGWSATLTLDEGLQRTIAWYKKFFGVQP